MASQGHQPEPMNLSVLIDSVPALIHTALPDGYLDFFNQTWLEYVGLSLEDLQGWKWTAVIHPEDVKGIVEKWRASLASGEPFLHEARVRRADGEYRWMLHHKVPARDERGNIVRWYGSSIDIEDRKRAEEKVRQDERELRAIVETIPAFVGTALPDGSVDFISQSWLDYTGLSREEWLGWGWMTVIHPEDLDSAVTKWKAVLATGEPIEHEARIRLADGRHRWFLGRGVPLRNKKGNIVKWYGTIFDIDDRKGAEDASRHSEAYLAQAQRLSHTGSFGWMVSTGELSWSEETFRIFGYDRTTKPTLELVLQRVHPEDTALVKQTIERASQEAKDFDYDYRLLMPDGSVKYVRVMAHALSAEPGSVEFVGSVMDITAAKEAEEKIRQDERELRQLIDAVPQHIYVLGPDGTFLYANQRDLEYTGLIPEDVLGPDYLAMVWHPDDVERLRHGREDAIARGVPWESEGRLLGKDGQYRWFLIRINPLRDEQGRIIRWYGTRTDIEDRKQAEEKIRQDERELRQLIDVIPQHILVEGPDGSRLYANQGLLRYHGLAMEDVRAEGFSARVTHPDDLEKLLGEYQRGASRGASFQIEARLRRKDGQYRWFLIHYNPARDEQGRITLWYVTATDIEDRKQVEERVQEENVALREEVVRASMVEERVQEENVALREEVVRASMFEEIVGTSPALKTVLSRVSKVAPTDSTVLITGETGTGKELIARAIHKRSQRSARAFVSVNCAVIPRDLIASELFGHEKGAFTGATQRHLGRFEMAEGGTIFLDEVGDLPAETQLALLRVLQEHEFERVGGTRSIHADVRVIAATNRDLHAAIAAGTFRSDLFYRLNVFPIEIPPLRERREDIPLLVEYFIDRYVRKAGKSIRRINKKSLDLLQSYHWPGNIRELQNVIERSVIVCEGEDFSVDESWLWGQSPASEPKGPLELSQKLAAQEKEMIEAALRQSHGRVSGPMGAAAKLGMPRSTLESKIRSLKINKNLFRRAF